MKKRYLACLFFCFSVLQSNTSCELINRDKICEAIHLSDLYCEQLYLDNSTVFTGAAFVLTTVIKNIAETTKLCETETAAESDTGIKVEYRADRDSPWEDTQFEDEDGVDTYEMLIPTNSLAAAEETRLESTMMMDTPGLYRFQANIDRNNVVVERDEGNNTMTSGEGLLNKTISSAAKYTVVIEVLPAVGYAPAKGMIEAPKVKYLGYRVVY